MKFSYMVIAGPQAAGKTTIITFIKKDNRNIFPLREARDIVNSKYKFKGAISMTTSDEIEAIELDIDRMKSIEDRLKNDPSSIYLDECNLFTLAHASMRGISTGKHLINYCQRLTRLNPLIIFLDSAPKNSWIRRKNAYNARLNELSPHDKEKALYEYKRYMDGVYPRLKALYQEISLPKIYVPSLGSLLNSVLVTSWKSIWRYN